MSFQSLTRLRCGWHPTDRLDACDAAVTCLYCLLKPYMPSLLKEAPP